MTSMFEVNRSKKKNQLNPLMSGGNKRLYILKQIKEKAASLFKYV